MPNNFKQWVDSPIADTNVQAKTSFIEDEQRTVGFKAGDPASALRVNSALHQANLICVALMQACYEVTQYTSDLNLLSSMDDVKTAIRNALNSLDTATLNSAKAYTDAARTALQQAINTIDVTVDGHTNTLANIAKWQTTTDDEIAALSGGTSTLGTRVSTLEDEMDEAQPIINAHTNSISGLTTRMGTAESNITSLEGTTAGLIADVADLKSVADINVATTDWTGSTGNFSYTILAATHGRGKYPQVRTFVDGEETYDSPKIDFATGNVTVYSNTAIALRVIIY